MLLLHIIVMNKNSGWYPSTAKMIYTSSSQII